MLSDAMAALHIVLSFLPFSFLRYYPFLNKLRISIKRLCGIYLALLLLQIVSFIWLYNRDFLDLQLMQRYRIVFGFLHITLSFIVIKEKFFKHFFVYLIMFTYAVIVSRNAYIVEELLSLYFAHTSPFLIMNVVILLQLLLSYPFVFRFIKIKFTPLLETKNTDVWNYIWIIPMMIIVLVAIVDFELSRKAAFDWKYYISRFLMSLGNFLSCFILIKILEQTNQNATLNENIRMTSKLIVAQTNHYKMLTEYINKAKAAKHDLHHHILVLQSYLQDKEFLKLEEYLNKYQVRLEKSVQPVICNNYVVDAILQHYLASTKTLMIQFTVKVDMLVQIAMDDFDLCIILGNAIENAIEACQRMQGMDRFIELNIKMVGNMLVITIDNSYDGIVKVTDTSLLSSKRTGDKEGVGLDSIESVVNKYHGILDLAYTEDIFKTSIMLNLTNS